MNGGHDSRLATHSLTLTVNRKCIEIESAQTFHRKCFFFFSPSPSFVCLFNQEN